MELEVVEVKALEEGFKQFQVAHQDIHDVLLCGQEFIG